MRKLLLMFFISVLLNSAKPLLMLSPEDGGESKCRTPGSHRINYLPYRKDFKSFLKNSKDISTANWEIQYHNYDWFYYMPRPVQDTQASRFVPPTECSLVAFTVMNYNTTTGQVGQPYYLFVADQRMDIDIETETVLYESPWGPKFPDYDNIISYAKGNFEWDTIQTEIYIPFENLDADSSDSESHYFWCGYRPGTDNFAILATGNVPCSSPGESHSWRFKSSLGYYYTYYFPDDHSKIEFGISAYIRLLRNVPPKITPDILPNTYDTGERLVFAHCEDIGIPDESTGIQNALIEYSVNGGVISSVPMSLYSGDSTNGYWAGSIPGANVGDTVTYRTIATDYQGLADTTGWMSYVIKGGRPGYALYIKGNSIAIFNNYIEFIYYVDVWDISTDGPPDQSVFDFYTPTKGPGNSVVLWKGWGETDLSYVNYGSGVLRAGDTTYIKQIIDGGGGFWLEDQDGLYACGSGIWGDYGTHTIESGFLHDYFGIITGTDDGPFSGADSFSVYGDSSDPVVGPIFDGVSYQVPGKILHAPIQGNPQNEWAGVIDSAESTSVPDMRDPLGNIISLRNEAAGTGGAGKTLFHIFSSSWIARPDQPLYFWDELASDSLQDVYLQWFGVLGVNERNPDIKLIEISNPRIMGNEVLMNIFLPVSERVKVFLYDKTGRKIKVVYEGEMVGLRTISYDLRNMKSDVYFFVVYVNGEMKGTRKFLVVK